jgi:hypothetical protein
MSRLSLARHVVLSPSIAQGMVTRRGAQVAQPPRRSRSSQSRLPPRLPRAVTPPVGDAASPRHEPGHHPSRPASVAHLCAAAPPAYLSSPNAVSVEASVEGWQQPRRRRRQQREVGGAAAGTSSSSSSLISSSSYPAARGPVRLFSLRRRPPALDLDEWVDSCSYF